MFPPAPLAVALALVLVPACAIAQEGRWFPGVSAGYASRIGNGFEGLGSVTASGSIFRAVGRRVDLGVELGYHGLGTTTTRLTGLYGPGSSYREDFSRSAWQLTAGVRFRPLESAIRPYLSAGGGVYLLRIRDVIEARDAAGQVLPQYEFRQTDHDLFPGLNAGIGADRLVSLGRIGLGLHARWHGIVSEGVGSFFTVAVGLGLN